MNLCVFLWKSNVQTSLIFCMSNIINIWYTFTAIFLDFYTICLLRNENIRQRLCRVNVKLVYAYVTVLVWLCSIVIRISVCSCACDLPVFKPLNYEQKVDLNVFTRTHISNAHMICLVILIQTNCFHCLKEIYKTIALSLSLSLILSLFQEKKIAHRDKGTVCASFLVFAP